MKELRRMSDLILHIVAINLALAIGEAIEDDKRRRPFHYCILELEMKLEDLPLFGRFIAFLDRVRDERLVRNWLKNEG